MNTGTLNSTAKYFLKSKALKISLVLVILLAVIPFYFKDKVEQSVLQRSASRVQIIRLKPASETVIVSGYGTVESSRTLEVRPQVSGHLMSMHPQLEEGGRIREHERLAELDPADYLIQIDARKADLVRAEAELKIEQGNHMVAEREWEILKNETGPQSGSSDLALRVPYIKEKEAALLAAHSQVRKAQLDLERTTITAPFDALVLLKGIEIGAYVDQGTLVAKLAATDRFYVKVLISDDQLRWLPLTDAAADVKAEKPGEKAMPVQPEPEVRIIQQRGGERYIRPGKLHRVLGSVESSGRMAQLLVAIDDPLSSLGGVPPLLLGTYVKVEIPGTTVTDVIKIPRKALRAQDRVFVADRKDRLRSRMIEIVYTTDDAVTVRNNFQAGDRLVVSNLETPLEGTKLEIEEKDNPS